MTEQAKLQYTGSERFWLLAKSKTTTCRRAALPGRIFRSIDIIYLETSIYLADTKRTNKSDHKITRPFYFLACVLPVPSSTSPLHGQEITSLGYTL